MVLMKKSLLLLPVLLLPWLAGSVQAQESKPAAAGDTLVVLWSSGDPEVAENACLMYTQAARRNNWFREVILIIWGPSQKLIAGNQDIRDRIAAMEKDGVIVQACIACSNAYGITNDLKACSVDVRGMGIPLTNYLKRGYRVVSF